MYSGLITLGKDLQVEPELAKSWSFSKDCLTLDFQLREDVKWHDGKPFTADDVVFTWEATMDPKTPSSYKSDFQDVERVEKTGPLLGTGDLQEALRQGAGVVGRDDPAQAPARELREGRQDQGSAAELVGAGRHRPVPLPGDEERREDRGRRQPRLLQGAPAHLAHRLPRHPQPGHDLPRGEGHGRGRGQSHRAAVPAADRVPGVREGVQQVSLPRRRLHLLRLQPQGSALRRPPRAPGPGPRHQQARPARRRRAGARAPRPPGRSGRATGRTTPTSRASPTIPRRRLRCSPTPGGSATARGCWRRTASPSPSSC